MAAAGWPEACGEEWFINMFVSESPPPLNVGAMLIAWCSDIWKPPSGGQKSHKLSAPRFPEYLKWSRLLYRDEKRKNGGGRISLSCHNMVSLSEVCHTVFGWRGKKNKKRQASARSVPLIFISPEVNEFNIRFNTGLLFFFPFLPPTCSTSPVKSLNNNSFLGSFCVDRAAALECNLNNICIFCCILYKISALGPSFCTFNHWAPGGCGYLLFEAVRKKKGREQRRVRMWGKKKKCL